jgi:hypothetical protein
LQIIVLRAKLLDESNDTYSRGICAGSEPLLHCTMYSMYRAS